MPMTLFHSEVPASRCRNCSDELYGASGVQKSWDWDTELSLSVHVYIYTCVSYIRGCIYGIYDLICREITSYSSATAENPPDPRHNQPTTWSQSFRHWRRVTSCDSMELPRMSWFFSLGKAIWCPMKNDRKWSISDVLSKIYCLVVSSLNLKRI